MRYNTANFASYGSEKRGTPVKSYIRYAEPDKEIRISSPVEAASHRDLSRTTGGKNWGFGRRGRNSSGGEHCEIPDEIRREFQMHGGV
ncbi:MAG: hypothetical protein ACLR23_02645 [Clostridia bacterium]